VGFLAEASFLIWSVVPEHHVAGPWGIYRQLSVHVTALSANGYGANTDCKRIGATRFLPPVLQKRASTSFCKYNIWHSGFAALLLAWSTGALVRLPVVISRLTLHLYRCVARRKPVREAEVICKFNRLPACAKWIQHMFLNYRNNQPTTNQIVEECIYWFSATAITLHLTWALREWPFSYGTIKATMCNPSGDPKGEHLRAICSGAWHKWLTVEHSTGNNPLPRRQTPIQPFLLWDTEEHLRDLKIFPLTKAKQYSSPSASGRVIILTVHWDLSLDCHQRSGFTSFLLVPLLALGRQAGCPINIRWCQLAYQSHSNTITQPFGDTTTADRPKGSVAVKPKKRRKEIQAQAAGATSTFPFWETTKPLRNESILLGYNHTTVLSDPKGCWKN